jgi:hypothetical protein
MTPYLYCDPVRLDGGYRLLTLSFGLKMVNLHYGNDSGITIAVQLPGSKRDPETDE